MDTDLNRTLRLISRRELLALGIAGASAGVALSVTGCGSGSTVAARQNINLNLYFSWSDEQAKYLVTVPRAEMGQGLHTTLAGILLSELKLPFSRVKIQPASADPAYGSQRTVGSASIRKTWQQFKTLGAQLRQWLLNTAAGNWSVSPAECSLDSGIVQHSDSGRSVPIHELLPQLKKQQMPDQVTWQAALKNTVEGIDQNTLTDIVTGTQQYAGDTTDPDLLNAMVIRAPVPGSHVVNANLEALKNLPGITSVFLMKLQGADKHNAVALAGSSFYHLLEARKKADIQWSEPPFPKTDTTNLADTLGKNSSEPSLSATQVTQSYYTAPLAHQTMETPTCIAAPKGKTLLVTAPTQDPGGAVTSIAKALGLNESDIHLNNIRLGGGFGRKRYTDFIVEAALIAQQVQRPVKLIWTREDDIQHDFYRPATWQELSWNLNKQAPIDHRIVTTELTTASASASKKSFHYFASGANTLMNSQPSSIPFGIWRAVHHGYEDFALGVFIDECAQAQDQNTIEYVLQNIPERSLVEEVKFRMAPEYKFDHHRMTAVIKAVKQASGWPTTNGHQHQERHLGFAHCHAFYSYVATVVEVKPVNGELKVSGIWSAIDCGTPINPDQIKAQLEGGNLFALSAALYGNVHFEAGAVKSGNFDDLPIIRMSDTPAIHITVMDSDESPTGVGELAVPPLAPALINAIYQATGKRVRRLPVTPNRMAHNPLATIDS